MTKKWKELYAAFQASKEGPRTYSARDELLKTLGFDSYKYYTQSLRWKIIRASVLARDKYECRFCSMPTRTVHHLSYARSILIGEDLIPLVSLCKDCHTLVDREYIQYDKES